MSDIEATVMHQVINELRDVSQQLVQFGHAEYKKYGRGACVAQFSTLEEVATCAAPSMAYKAASSCSVSTSNAVKQYDPFTEIVVLITLLSLGEAREFVFASESGVEQERVVIEDGGVFVLQATNATLRHVLPVKAEFSISDEAGEVPRISASG
jgi:hypothetical protein